MLIFFLKCLIYFVFVVVSIFVAIRSLVAFLNSARWTVRRALAVNVIKCSKICVYSQWISRKQFIAISRGSAIRQIRRLHTKLLPDCSRRRNRNRRRCYFARYNGNVHDRYPIDSQLNWIHSGHYSTVDAITARARVQQHSWAHIVHTLARSLSLWYLCVSERVYDAASAPLDLHSRFPLIFLIELAHALP